ncbi:MAG: PorV/PorQ family protein [Ignavibacteriales bacterium]|nr:MAG: PorV/PorQ family protein [Ignavibacteriales bacterium]
MKLIKNLSLLVILLFIIPQKSYSQVDLKKTAQSTMNFLLVGTSSRAASLGDAFTVIGKGSESIFYNPAGLTSMKNEFDISLNYTGWIADINYLSGSASWNSGNLGVFGFHLLVVDYGTINGTSLLSEDQTNNSLGYIDNGVVSNVSAYSLGLSYAKSISNAFSLGGTIKLTGQNLGENLYTSGVQKNNASKIAFDAGVKYQTQFNDFVFGMSIRNFATNIKREEIEEQLPLLFSLGAAINVMKVISPEIAPENSIILATDFLHQNNYSERVNIGIEYTYMNMVSLRGGYQTNRDLASWSGGIGLHTSLSGYDVSVSYSYSSFEVFNSVNRLSVSFSF